MPESRFLTLFDSVFIFWIFMFFIFQFKTVGGGPTRQSLFFACAKKSNQKKAHNLTKIDPDITYSLWDGFIQYTLAAPTKTFFTRLSCSSISELASSQYHSDPQTFQNTMRLQRTSSVGFFLF